MIIQCLVECFNNQNPENCFIKNFEADKFSGSQEMEQTSLKVSQRN